MDLKVTLCTEGLWNIYKLNQFSGCIMYLGRENYVQEYRVTETLDLREARCILDCTREKTGGVTCLHVGAQQLIVELGIEPGQSAFWHILLSLGKLQGVCPWGG